VARDSIRRYLAGMVIAGLGTAAPRRYTQAECWEALQQSSRFPGLSARSRAILRKVLTGRNGIAARHLALDPLAEAFDLTPDTLHARFVRHAPALAAEAARAAMKDAAVIPTGIDALLLSTCTGYLCPGLSSYVIERLDLPANVLALDLVGQGCGAALPNLRAAEALLASGRCRCVLSVCVEVCSAAFYLDEDPGVLISACLFGDGAGAVVLANEPGAKRRIQWRTGSSLHDPSLRDQLRFEQKNGMLRNVLSLEVPRLAAAQNECVLEQTLASAGVSKNEIAGWIVHPGGRDVLLAVGERLGLSETDLRWSAGVLEEYGNLSSPSVFFVLQAALNERAPGGYWWMTSFGAGFSGHGALWWVE
jgi:alkylresorcinol/alkylpyrone synthase